MHFTPTQKEKEKLCKIENRSLLRLVITQMPSTEHLTLFDVQKESLGVQLVDLEIS